jgi:NAD(P)-dependent dehydrogenase (short-subunit alcohol dehydrogenase family)
MAVLDGRTAIVTGAGRGLGRAHALLLAELGAAVVVNDADPDGADGATGPAQAVVEEIRARGGRATAHVGSVADWETAEDLIRMAVETFGGLDILVNNAGILRDRFLVSMSESEWDSVIDVHLKGHFCPLRHAAAYWRAESKAGRAVNAAVINTSSGAGLRGNPGQLNYAAAKAGIATMTLVAARELERYGVRVNAIAPVARTRLTADTPLLRDRMTAGAGFDPWEPANTSPLVAWLAAPQCRLSGQVFAIVGGRIALQRTWTEVETFEVDHRWTVEELQAALDELPAGPSEFVVSA